MQSKIFGIIGATAFALVFSVPSFAEEPSSLAKDPILATVNGSNITKSAYDRYIATRPSAATRERRVVLEEMANRALVLEDALKRGVDKSPEIIGQINTLRENVLVAAGLKAVAETMPVSEEEQHKFYSERVSEMAVKEYKARHILVPTEEEAKAILEELNKGADFAALAKEKSKDNAAEGGDLGWFNVKQMVKPFADAITSLEKGKLVAKPVQTEFGWHVILLEDTRETPAPTFESMKPKIKNLLQRAKLQEYVQSLRATAKVEIKPEVQEPSAAAPVDPEGTKATEAKEVKVEAASVEVKVAPTEAKVEVAPTAEKAEKP